MPNQYTGPRALADRFWAKVDRAGGPLTCWPWRGATNGSHRYARGRPERRPSVYLAPGVTAYAHRVALSLTDGVPLWERVGIECCHRCEGTGAHHLCCNPAHLYWGTRADNDRDRYRGGRG